LRTRAIGVSLPERLFTTRCYTNTRLYLTLSGWGGERRFQVIAEVTARHSEGPPWRIKGMDSWAIGLLVKRVNAQTARVYIVQTLVN